MKRAFIVLVAFSAMLILHSISLAGSAMEVEKKDNNRDVDPEILWWYDLDAPSFGSAAAADIDNDGYLEVVFGTYFNDETIHALNGEDGSPLWSYPTNGCNDASPVIADVDLDGELEVVVPTSSTGIVYCFDGATGTVEWSTNTGYSIDSPPAVADVDNDGKPEVLFGAFLGRVFCLNGEDGSILYNRGLGYFSYIQTAPNILDVDDNNRLDVVVAQWLGETDIHALRGNNGSTIWTSGIPRDNIYHAASFADVDEDGRPELAFACYDNHIYLINAEDGSLEWSYTAPNYCGSPTCMADLNGDGHYEVVYTSYNIIGVLSHTGQSIWSRTTGGSMFRGPAISDIDGDGMLDVVVGCDDGILRVFNGENGDTIWTCDLQAHYGRTFEMDHAPLVGDFNNDGLIDVFMVGGYGISSPPTNNHGRAYLLTAGEGTGPEWLMFHRDHVHSGCVRPETAPVTIAMIPDNPPVVVNPGGAFTFTGILTNNTDQNQIIDVAVYLDVPGIGFYGPIMRYNNVRLSPYHSITVNDIVQEVPSFAPLGEYDYIAYCGEFPHNRIDSASFNFTVVAPAGGKADNWNLYNWFGERTEAVPLSFALIGNYPNPFNAATEIRYSLSEYSRVKIEVFNLLGQKVDQPFEGGQSAGVHLVNWNANGFASGIYFYRITADGRSFTRRMTLLK